VHADDRARHRDHELLWLGVSPDASATDLSITPRAEVSLDSTSCKFIAPGKWRPQLKEILNDAMTRVDVGVAEHLKKVESLMSNSVHGVASVLVASEHQMIHQIKEHLELWLVTAHLA
jgi:hypothetical protein